MTDILSPERFPTLVEANIEGLLRIIEELKRSLPPFGPHPFAEALEEVIIGVQRYFPMELALVSDQQERVARCKKYLSLLQELHEQYLRRLGPLNEELVPSELLSSLEEQISILLRAYSQAGESGSQNIDPSYDLRLAPFWNWNYETTGYMDLVGFLLKRITIPDRKMSAPTTPFPRWFIFIEYPIAWSRYASPLPIFVHEVGHFVDWTMGLQARVGPMPFDEESFLECITQYQEPPLNKTEYAARLLAHRRCSQILKAWQTEYICDVIAIRLLGPAYFFTFADLSVLLDILQSSSPSHPPSGFRLVHQYEELTQMGYLREPSSLKEILQRAHQELQPHLQEPTNLEEKVVYRSLSKGIIYNDIGLDPPTKEQLQGIRKHIVGPILELSYNSDRYEREVPHISARYLSQGNALGDLWFDNIQKAIEFRTIVNSGWHTYLLHAEEYYQTVGARTDAERRQAHITLGNLILKSVESAYIFKKYPKGLS